MLINARKWSLAGALLIAGMGMSAHAGVTALGTQPLVTRANVAPNVLFALSVEFPTANTAAYQDASGYLPTNEYLGYFDPNKCYQYDGTNDWFYPVRKVADRTCAGTAWSGNFLNWGTMTGLDAFRMAMTGGNRYRDNGATGVAATQYLTVLERANHSGQAGFAAKNMTSSSGNRTLNLATPVLGPSTDGNVTLFSTGLNTEVRVARSVVGTTNSLTFSQLPGSTVKEVKIIYKNYTTSSQSNITYKAFVPAGTPFSSIVVTGSTYNYNAATGEINFLGLGSSLSRDQTKQVVVSYPTSNFSPTSTFTAGMYRSGSVWGEIALEKDYYVRVKVCDNAIGLESNCQLYGTASYKPVGVIQQNGPDMRFGVFSYYNSNATNNAVMRARLKTTSPSIPQNGENINNPAKEWSDVDGTFFNNPDAGVQSYTTFDTSGVINYINKFGRTNSYKTYDNIGRLYYAALSYLRNRPADTGFYTGATNDNAEGFPVIPAAAWDDPLTASCQANYLIMLGDNHTHCDKKLPGGRFSSSVSYCSTDTGSLSNGDTVDVYDWTKKLSDAEGLSNWQNTSIQSTNNSSTYLAGMAYYARTTDIRPDNSERPATLGKQTVKTYIINVEENGDKAINTPFWYATKYGGFDDVNGNVLPTTASSWSTADNTFSGGRRPKTLLPASNPKAMMEGVQSALRTIAADSGSASAAATSSPNVTQTNNYLYSSTYRTIFWDGEVTAQRLDYATGNILPGTIWQGTQTVNTQADSLSSGNTTARKLYTFNTAASGVDKKKTFDYISLTTQERSWFSNKCTNGTADAFLQCTDGSLTAAQRTSADSGTNLVNFLRGYNNPTAFTTYGYLDIYRANRINRLGDIVNAAPVYVGAPLNNFAMTTGGESYLTYKTRVSARPGVLYIAANDGFLHAFRGTDGNELFAYAPRQILPDMYKIADKAFGTNHRYFVDGTPVIADVYDTTLTKWRTILVGGLNNGGSGYYALDVTDPTAPQALWEACRDATRCPTNTIATMGNTFGNPVITRLPTGHTHAGRWVVLVSSGYNNSTGYGYVYVLDAVTGQLLDTYSTATGEGSDPSGLAKLSTFAPNYGNDGVSSIAYGGDLKGNIWRFDLTKAGNHVDAVKKIVQLTDSDGNSQPVMSKIEVSTVPNKPTWPALFVGTGRYLATSDFTDLQSQSVYGMKDPFSSGVGSTYSASRGSGWVNQTVVDRTTGGVTTRTIDNPKAVNWVTNNGWHIDLPDTGERVALDLQLNLGTLLVATNVVTGDAAAACQVGGYSWLYQLNYANGSYIPSAPSQQAAVKFNNALLVGNTVTRLPSGALKVISTTAKGDKVTGSFNTGGGAGGARRISWREVF